MKDAPRLTMKVCIREDGALEIVRVPQRFRFMFADGATLDVIADRDDSEMRAAVLNYAGKERIEGVAVLPEQESLVL